MKTNRLVRRALAAVGTTTLLIGLVACGPTSGTASVRSAEAPGGPTGSETIVPADPAIVAEVDAAMAATARACSQPDGQTPAGATEARQVVPGKIAVFGSDGASCLVGVADPIVVSDTEPIPDFVPVYAIEEPATVIGYWADGLGWVTPEQRNDPSFDLAAHRAAYAQIMASGPGPHD